MSKIDPELFLTRLQALAGARDRAEAERIARATVSALLELLPQDAHAGVLRVLPAALQALRVREIARPDETLEAFYERVAAREGLPPGVAIEHAQCVCRALAERLDGDTRDHLLRRLPDALAPLFAPVESDAPRAPAPPHHAPAPPHTLSGGRPGSRRPLAEAAPQPAHAHSVARSDDPHADTKLSSNRGETQEREHETLGEGRPGSKRPLGEG